MYPNWQGGSNKVHKVPLPFVAFPVCVCVCVSVCRMMPKHVKCKLKQIVHQVGEAWHTRNPDKNTNHLPGTQSKQGYFKTQDVTQSQDEIVGKWISITDPY